MHSRWCNHVSFWWHWLMEKSLMLPVFVTLLIDDKKAVPPEVPTIKHMLGFQNSLFMTMMINITIVFNWPFWWIYLWRKITLMPVSWKNRYPNQTTTAKRLDDGPRRTGSQLSLCKWHDITSEHGSYPEPLHENTLICTLVTSFWKCFSESSYVEYKNGHGIRILRRSMEPEWSSFHSKSHSLFVLRLWGQQIRG